VFRRPGTHGLPAASGSQAYSLRLTLDKRIQYIAERELHKTVSDYEAKSGTTVVIDPQSGEILAMAISPTFNPNYFVSSGPSAWRNRAVTDAFEPGSTFKIITSSVAIEEKAVKPEATMFAENGSYKLHGAEIKDTKPRGSITFTDGLAYSSNILMVKAAMKIEPQAYYKYLRSFGFGMKTGIALPAEEGGRKNGSRRLRRSAGFIGGVASLLTRVFTDAE